MEREQLSRYSGMGTVFDSRVACMRPNVHHVNFTYDANATSPIVKGHLKPIVEALKFPDLDTGSSQTVIRGDTQLAVFKFEGQVLRKSADVPA